MFPAIAVVNAKPVRSRSFSLLSAPKLLLRHPTATLTFFSNSTRSSPHRSPSPETFVFFLIYPSCLLVVRLVHNLAESSSVDLPSARRLHRLPQRLDYNLIPAPLGKT